ncbi:MAG: PilZ domain-containing protein [Vulcanimicrobiota bacterium]
MWNLRGLLHHHKKTENTMSEGDRKFRRISVILSINCSVSQGQFRIMTENVSFCGIRFLSPLELPVNDNVDLSILLHSHMPAILIKAQVISCETVQGKGRMIYSGVLDFGAMKDEDRRTWENYVKRYETEDDPFKTAA